MAEAAAKDTTSPVMTSVSHTASRTIIATPRAIFRAFLDPEVLVKWRAPAGMDARLDAFDPRRGGGYRMTLTYIDAYARAGKTTANSDVVQARFVEIEPDERIVEAIDFESNDPDFAGTMTFTSTMRPVTGGTKVTFLAENVPAGVTEEDHRKGMESALKNLANLLE